LMIVEVRNSFGLPQKVRKDVILELTSSSPMSRFDVMPNGTFDGSVVSIGIPVGRTAARFYYKDLSPVASLITVREQSGHWQPARHREKITK
jgi:hypothetical protein